MKNKNYYSFERNQYYYGKMLTVRDFEVEQQYFNNKRRLINKILNGAGVVAGMDVILVDDQSLWVESGIALDYHGREIIVQEPVLKKLHLIEGFEQVKNSARVYLCIEYDEFLSEPVQSVVSTPAAGTGDSQFNRIAETYKLYLTDETLAAEALPEYKLEKTRKVIFENEKAAIEQIVPKYVRPGDALEITINIIKKSIGEPVELKYEIKSNFLRNEKGEKSVYFAYAEQGSQPDSQVRQTVLLYADSVNETLDRLSIGDFQLKLGTKQYSLEQEQDFEVQIITEPIRERLMRAYHRQDFNEMVVGNHQSRLYLAKLNLITANDLYIIDSLEKMPYQQYVFTNELAQILLKSKQAKETAIMVETSQEEKIRRLVADCLSDNREHVGELAAGVEELELGYEGTKQKTFFSNEIAHGLGAGAVSLVLALEDNRDLADETKERPLIFGDSSVFAKSPYGDGLPEYQLGSLAYPDKGTFRIGLRLLSNLKAASIRIRWWAYKHLAEELKDTGWLELGKVKVLVSPDTVTVAPRGRVYFTALVEGTNNWECRWYVKEDKGGKIDLNGVYEAPNTEGVFEVIAESVKYPGKQASAFVVVKD